MVLKSEDRRVVVTGAGGFIGRAVCTQLSERGWSVRGLVRALDPLTAARPDMLPVGDLAVISDTALAHALRGTSAVVHLAARVHGASAAQRAVPADFRRVNVDATERIARAAAAARVGHFVFASSVKVNGEATVFGRPFRESDPPDPHDAYAASKWEAERALGGVAEDTGMRITALRLPLTYGAGAKANFARLVEAVAQRRPLPFARIVNRRSLLGIGNLVSALESVLADAEATEAKRLTPYFVADAEAVSTPELVRAIAAALGVAPRLFGVPAGLLNLAGACSGRSAAVDRLTGSLEVDTTAFCERFDWRPPSTLAQGLAAMK